MKVKKAVILAAGMGTRMLPSSKVIPKEILPVVDTPAIQVVVEEAVASGIEEIVIVVSPGKTTVVEHFNSNLELERHLEERGKNEILEIVRRSNNPAKITVAEQAKPLRQAVQVVAYELFMVSDRSSAKEKSEKLATVADIEGMYAHLEDASIRSGFYVPASRSKLPERLRRLFSRVPQLEREEVNIVRGLLKALLAKWPGNS